MSFEQFIPESVLRKFLEEHWDEYCEQSIPDCKCHDHNLPSALLIIFLLARAEITALQTASNQSVKQSPPPRLPTFSEDDITPSALRDMLVEFFEDLWGK